MSTLVTVSDINDIQNKYMLTHMCTAFLLNSLLQQMLLLLCTFAPSSTVTAACSFPLSARWHERHIRFGNAKVTSCPTITETEPQVLTVTQLWVNPTDSCVTLLNTAHCSHSVYKKWQQRFSPLSAHGVQLQTSPKTTTEETGSRSGVTAGKNNLPVYQAAR